MASCMTLSSGICRGCRDNVGGLKAIYVADYYSVDWTSLATAAYTGEVTELSLVEGSHWYRLEPNKYSASWTENINVSVENGTLGYEQVITGVFGKNAQALRNTIEELAKGDLVLVLLDANDTMWLIGAEHNGAYVSGGNSASGTALTDLNGWNVNFTCNAKAPALQVIPADGSDLEEDLAAADCD